MISMIIFSFLRLFRWIFDHTCDLIYYIIYESEYKKLKALPPISNGSPILVESATSLANKIINREPGFSAVLAVKAYAERIKQVNGIINGVVDTRFDEALEEAELVDQKIRKVAEESKDALRRLAAEKPFLGVPFTTKDCFAVTGLSYTAGLLARGRRKVRASFDAEVVQRMRLTGAIPIAVTNVPELCMWMETSNKIYGRTANPYHPGRISGGSSGGEGATIASGASVFGIGSDVGGSIRMPSFFNGIFGHKPSTGVVANGPGQIPVAYGKIDEFLVTGPMCRYACDLLPMLKAIVKKEKLNQLRLNENVSLRELKLYYMVDNAGGKMETPIHKDLYIAQMNLIAALENELGIKAKQVKLSDLRYSFMIWSYMMQTEEIQPAFGQDLREVGVGEKGINPYIELLKWCAFKMSDHTFPAICLALLEKFVQKDDPLSKKFLQKFKRLKNKLDTLLGDDGVLIYPSHPTPAPYHGLPLLRPFNPGYTAIFNVLGNPVTQVPLGLGSWNVPLGVQLVSGINQDRNTLALALVVEKLFGGWVQPIFRS